MNTLTLLCPPETTVTVLSNDFIDNYMPGASGEYVKVYLYFLRYCTYPSSGAGLISAADTFSTTESDIMRALRYWEKQGLMRLSFQQNALSSIEFLSLPVSQKTESYLKTDTYSTSDAYLAQTVLSPDIPPVRSENSDREVNMYNGVVAYTEDTLEDFKNHMSSNFFFIIEQYLGKPLGQTDMNIFVYLHENLKMSEKLIEYLVEDCVSSNHYSIHYIEKVALAWASEGIDTVEKAKARSSRYRKDYSTIMKAYGINNRMLTPGEQDYIQKWTREYGFPMTIILEAIQRTMNAIHQPSFSYTQTILEKWYQNNVGSLNDVRTLDQKHAAQQAQKKQAAQAKSNAQNTSQAQNTSKQPPKNNRFHNFEQRNYDYSSIQKALLAKNNKK